MCTCSQCRWFTTPWKGRSCKDDGILPNDEPCGEYDERYSIEEYQKLPPIKKAFIKLRSEAFRIDPILHQDLEKALLKDSAIPEDLNSDADLQKLGGLVSTVQSHRDRVVEILDVLNRVSTRLNALIWDCVTYLNSLKDVRKLSTKSDREQAVGSILRPLYMRYESIEAEIEFSKRILTNLREKTEAADLALQIYRSRWKFLNLDSLSENL